MLIGIPSRERNTTIEDYKNNFKLIKEAGFESIDLQSFLHIENNYLYSCSETEFIDFLAKVKEEARINNLIINQLHSYWIFPPVLDYTNDGINEQIDYYKRSILGAKVLGTKYVVIHNRFPFGLEKEINDLKEEEFFKINVDFLNKLKDYAKENDVILSLENLPMDFKYCKVDGVIRIVDTVNSEYVKICLDTGHANVFNDNIYDDIIKIGDRLVCLHIHDNKWGNDLHVLPYEGSINWNDVKRGLKDINYKGVFSFELLPNDNLSNETKLLGLRYIYSLGKEIIE